MNQTIVIDTKTGNEMLEVFRTLRDEVVLLRKTLATATSAPKYGTELWWANMNENATRDIHAGFGSRLESTKDIDAFFKNLQ